MDIEIRYLKKPDTDTDISIYCAIPKNTECRQLSTEKSVRFGILYSHFYSFISPIGIVNL